METKRDSEFDDYLKQAIQEVGIDSPSVNFTDGVMGKIKLSQNTTKVILYRPLISSAGWIGIAFGVLAFLIFVFFEGKVSSIEYFSGPKWDILMNSNFWQRATEWRISKTVIYGFAFLALFMSIQVVLLKHHFDKRYKLR